MPRFTIFAVVVFTATFFAASAFAEGPTEDEISEFAQRCRKLRPYAVAVQKQILEKRLEAKPKKRGEELVKWETQVQLEEDRLAKLQSPFASYYGQIAVGAPQGWPSMEGPLFYLGRKQVGIHTQINDTEALLLVSYTSYTTEVVGTGTGQQAFQRPVREESIYHLENYPIAKIDGFISGVFTRGHYQYESVAGVQRVASWRLVNIDPSDKRFTRLDELRTWTATSGHTTEAYYMGSERGRVILMNPEGKATKLTLTTLSQGDRDFVKEQVRAERLVEAELWPEK